MWRFGAAAALKVVKANKVDAELNGGADRKEAATAAAEFIRDGLVKLGPTFVKLGQVVSTRTDIFSDAYISVLKTLQDDVPAFSGKRAVAIVEKELGLKKITDKFTNFDETPLAAASLGQVGSGWAVWAGERLLAAIFVFI